MAESDGMKGSKLVRLQKSNEPNHAKDKPDSGGVELGLLPLLPDLDVLHVLVGKRGDLQDDP